MNANIITINLLLSATGFSAFASGGGSEYFDVNGTTAGFGSPSATALYDMAGSTLATTSLTSGFTSGSLVTSVVVANATGIVPGATMAGSGVPAGVMVATVSGTTVGFTGFISTSGSAGNYTFDYPLTWSTSGAGNVSTTSFTSGGTMIFGETANDTSLQGTFTINLDNSSPGNVLGGIAVNSTGLNITLTGITGVHPAISTIWKVASGSVLNIDDTSQAPGGMNFNNEPVELTGALTTSCGTINFMTPIGNNSTTATWVEIMPGGVVNFDWNNSNTSTFGGSYVLEMGSLNLETAAVCANAFSGFQSGSQLVIDAGTTIDNTSGNTQTLQLGSGVYNIGGNFTFVGSSSLNFGPAGVAFNNGTPTLTVNANQLEIDGVISSTDGAGLTKAGNGKLEINNVETYPGATTINGGTLVLGPAAAIPDSDNIFISNSAGLDVTALTSLTLSASQTLTIEGTTPFINGNVVMSPGSTMMIDPYTTLTVDGTFTLSDNLIVVVTSATPLPANNYTLITPVSGGQVLGSVANSTVTFTGAGWAAGDSASVQIKGGALVLSVAPQPPNLTSTYVGTNTVVVSWPDTGSYTLQQNANIAVPGGWATSLYPITTANNTNSITISPATGYLFFRLKQ